MIKKKIKIMNFLSIDFSNFCTSLYFSINNQKIQKFISPDNYENDHLVQAILDFLNQNNFTIDDLEEIFVNQGPGSFSNIRTSISVAKGFSIAKKLNLYGFDSFLLYAIPYYKSKNLIHSLIKIKKKYYLKSYQFNNLLASKIKEITINEVLSKLANNIIVCPKIAESYYDQRLINLPKLEFVKENYEILVNLKKTKYLGKDNLKPLYLS